MLRERSSDVPEDILHAGHKKALHVHPLSQHRGGTPPPEWQQDWYPPEGQLWEPVVPKWHVLKENDGVAHVELQHKLSSHVTVLDGTLLVPLRNIQQSSENDTC